MFTVKATYNGQTRKIPFPQCSFFPPYEDIQRQLQQVFPIDDDCYLVQVLFSSDASAPGQIKLAHEIRSAEQYIYCTRPYDGFSWPNATLRFMVRDGGMSPLSSTASFAHSLGSVRSDASLRSTVTASSSATVRGSGNEEPRDKTRFSLPRSSPTIDVSPSLIPPPPIIFTSSPIISSLSTPPSNRRMSNTLGSPDVPPPPQLTSAAESTPTAVPRARVCSVDSVKQEVEALLSDFRTEIQETLSKRLDEKLFEVLEVLSQSAVSAASRLDLSPAIERAPIQDAATRMNPGSSLFTPDMNSTGPSPWWSRPQSVPTVSLTSSPDAASTHGTASCLWMLCSDCARSFQGPWYACEYCGIVKCARCLESGRRHCCISSSGHMLVKHTCESCPREEMNDLDPRMSSFATRSRRERSPFVSPAEQRMVSTPFVSPMTHPPPLAPSFLQQLPPTPSTVAYPPSQPSLWRTPTFSTIVPPPPPPVPPPPPPPVPPPPPPRLVPYPSWNVTPPWGSNSWSPPPPPRPPLPPPPPPPPRLCPLQPRSWSSYIPAYPSPHAVESWSNSAWVAPSRPRPFTAVIPPYIPTTPVLSVVPPSTRSTSAASQQNDNVHPRGPDVEIPGIAPTFSVESPISSVSASRAMLFVHHGIFCDLCNETIKGVRHKCVDCLNYDLCSACMADRGPERHNPFHEFIDIRSPDDRAARSPRGVTSNGNELRPPVWSLGEQVSASVGSLSEEPGGNDPVPAPIISPSPPVPVAPSRVSHPATCDLCDSNIVGDRYKCAECPDFDTCSSCFRITLEQHPGHNFVKIRSKDDLIIRHRRNVAGFSPSLPKHSARCNSCSKVIFGVRYKCMHFDCNDFDLCADCEALPIPVHPENHPLLKIRTSCTTIPHVPRRLTLSLANEVVTPIVSPSQRSRSPVFLHYGDTNVKSARGAPSVDMPSIPGSWERSVPAPIPVTDSPPPAPRLSPVSEMFPSTELYQLGYMNNPNSDASWNNWNSGSVVSSPRVRPPPLPFSPAPSLSFGFFGPRSPCRSPPLSLWTPLHSPPLPLRTPNITDTELETHTPPLGQGAPFSPVPGLGSIDFFGPRSPRSPLLSLHSPTITNTELEYGSPEPDLSPSLHNTEFSSDMPVIPPLDDTDCTSFQPTVRFLTPESIHIPIVHTPPVYSLSLPALPTRSSLSSSNYASPEISFASGSSGPSSPAALPDVLGHLMTPGSPCVPQQSLEESETLAPVPEMVQINTGSILPSLKFFDELVPIHDFPSLPADSSSFPVETVDVISSPLPVVSQSSKSQAEFLNDVTVADGQVFPPGAVFMKAWRLRNNGPQSWSPNTSLSFVAGAALCSNLCAQTVHVGSVKAGDTVELWTGELRAPEDPGRYISYWRLKDEQNSVFGAMVWIDITVQESTEQGSSEQMSSSSVILPNPIQSVSPTAVPPPLSVHSTQASASSSTSAFCTLNPAPSECGSFSDSESDLSILGGSSAYDSDDGLWEDSRMNVRSNVKVNPASPATADNIPSSDYVVLFDTGSSGNEST
ncbi:hypothetical protein FISHEDRAFT_71503 [Fistulina hepatica ATCC 64428]|uniref:ZZ-type domain-containing protein n=1 Tax=Fistulina hepatica ATCC 64428 TaxID=1128425 RepID=A0A0D7AJD8_9AGAR|nr:hypothetical protein FISHEDRAFT_71503 [Fistulina hepatica ATCC 64428]